jgi:hypothetical protein
MISICRLGHVIFLSPSQNIPRNGVQLALSCAGCVCMFSADAFRWRMGFTRHCTESLDDDITFWYTERGRVLLGLPEPEIPTNPSRRTPALTVHLCPPPHFVDSRWVRSALSALTVYSDEGKRCWWNAYFESSSSGKIHIHDSLTSSQHRDLVTQFQSIPSHFPLQTISFNIALRLLLGPQNSAQFFLN